MASAPAIGQSGSYPSPAVHNDATEVYMNFCHSDEFPRTGLLKLLETGKNADLTFIIEGKMLRAHRIIVASQSTYFDSLLYGPMRESECNEIRLEDTPWRAFKSLLVYMYSGSVEPTDLQTALDLLTLADRYGFLSLHYSIGKSICKSGVIKISNILQTLFYADSCNAEMLHRHCVQYLNAEAEAIIESQSMMDLPKENLKWLLSRDFFIANELKIFEAVKKWKECNGFEVDEIADLLKCVRLSEISPNEIISTVCPSGLYPEAVTEEALRQKLSFQNKSKSRGKKASNLFDAHCNLFYSNFKISTLSEYLEKPLHKTPNTYYFTLISDASHEKSFITFQFDDQYLINHLRFDGRPASWLNSNNGTDLNNPYRYVLEVSTDMLHWDTVIDHSICKCYFMQDLYFPSVAARCIRLVITKSREYLRIRFICCGIQESTDELFRFHEGGSIAPVHEFTPSCMTHWITKEGHGKKCIFTFHQPYHISKIKFRIKGLEENPNHMGQVTVKVSLYNKASYFIEVANSHYNFSEEIFATFDERLVSIVTISISTYYNGATGEDLIQLILNGDLRIDNFAVLCQ